MKMLRKAADCNCMIEASERNERLGNPVYMVVHTERYDENENTFNVSRMDGGKLTIFQNYVSANFCPVCGKPYRWSKE